MQEKFQIKRSVQERILQILDIENITPYKFCKDLGFSQGYLDKRGAIGTDKYLKIIKYLSKYNPIWILNEEGEMLKQPEGSTMVPQDQPKDRQKEIDRLLELLDEKDHKLKKKDLEIDRLKKRNTHYGLQHVAEERPDP